MPNYEYTQPVDWAKEIHDQLYVLNLLTYAQTYPFKPEVRERIEKGLGLS